MYPTSFKNLYCTRVQFIILISQYQIGRKQKIVSVETCLKPLLIYKQIPAGLTS